MKQISFGRSGFERRAKRTRKQIFLQEMEQVMPWAELVALIEPHASKPGAKGGRRHLPPRPCCASTCIAAVFNLSDPAAEEALHDVPVFLDFAGLDIGARHLPDENTILRFRHLLEEHGLAEKILAGVTQILTDKGLLLRAGTMVDATIITAPSSTKNRTGMRDPEMVSSESTQRRTTKKGNQRHFGMKMYIGVDADSGLVHTTVGTAANAHDVTQAYRLLHGEEEEVFVDSGYRGAHKRQDIVDAGHTARWNVAMMAGKRRVLDRSKLEGQLLDQIETIKARIRAKVEHPFRVVKQQWDHGKVRYRGPAKNTNQFITLFALANLWAVRRRLLQTS